MKKYPEVNVMRKPNDWKQSVKRKPTVWSANAKNKNIALQSKKGKRKLKKFSLSEHLSFALALLLFLC